MIVYPYQKSSSGEYFPIIEFFAAHKNKIIRTSALIDSGATISVFREDVAQSLGIDIIRGKNIFLGGVGGRIRGYVHELELNIGGNKFICPIVFYSEYTVSLNLLGRDGFFKKFRITFEEKEKLVKVE